MAGRWAQSNNQQYVSTYIPLPLQEIAGLAQDYSTRYKQGKELPHQLSLLASKIKAAPFDYELKNQLLNDTQTKINDLVSKAKPEDYAKPEYQDKIKQLLTNFTGDERLNTINSNKKWFDDEYTKYKSNGKNAQDLDFTLGLDPNHPTGYKQNLTGKAYSGLNVTPFKDSYDDIAKIMSNIPAQGGKVGTWDFSKVQTLNNGETQVYNKTTNTWDKVTPEQVDKIAQVSTPLFGRTDSGLYRLRSALAPIYGEAVQNMNYDNLYQASQQSEEGKRIFNHVNELLHDDLNRGGFKQIKTNFTKDIDITKETDSNAVAKNKKNRETSSLFDTLGSLEGNVNTTPITKGQALINAGVNPNIVDENGNIKYSITNGSTPNSINKELTALKETYKGNETSPNYKQELLALQGKAQGAVSNQQRSNDYYSDLLKGANNLGLDIKKDYTKNGKIDFNKLKNDLIETHSNIAKQSSNIQELQSNLSEDLTSHYFGKYDNKDETFKSSPLVQKMSIYENGSPSKEITNIEDKTTLGENARIIGLDFNAPNPGTVSFSATNGKSETEPKLYNAVLPDQRLKVFMKPVHDLTTNMDKLSKGQLSTSESNQNVKSGSEVLGALATKIASSNDPNAQNKVNDLKQLVNSINNTKGKIVVGNNTIGDKMYIGTVTYENNKPVKHLFEVDIKTGTINHNTVDLGKVQNDESSIIQRMIAPGYDSQAKGYENKNIDYNN